MLIGFFFGTKQYPVGKPSTQRNAYLSAAGNAFFRPLKINRKKILSSWKTNGGRRNAVVAKNKFSSLLKSLIGSMVDNCQTNPLSSFGKTRTSPFNPSEVLAVLSSVEPDAEQARTSIGDVFIDHLNRLRYGEKEQQQKSKRKKMSVGQGENYGGTDLSAEIGPQPSCSNAELITADSPNTLTVQHIKKKRREPSVSEENWEHESNTNSSDFEERNGDIVGKRGW